MKSFGEEGGKERKGKERKGLCLRAGSVSVSASAIAKVTKKTFH